MKHKKLFLRIFAGIVVILFIMVIYNCVVRTDDDPQKLEKLEEEKAREAMYADTFDVVGDYLFPNQKVSNEDMALEADKDKKDEKASDEGSKKKEKTSADDDDDEIIESADISSDPTPAPPAPPAPAVEQMSKPTVTSVENQ